MRAVPRFSVRLLTSSTSSPSGITSSMPDTPRVATSAAGLLQALHGAHPRPQEHLGKPICRHPRGRRLHSPFQKGVLIALECLE